MPDICPLKPLEAENNDETGDSVRFNARFLEDIREESLIRSKFRLTLIVYSIKKLASEGSRVRSVTSAEA